jgi:GLPGLI family protein
MKTKHLLFSIILFCTVVQAQNNDSSAKIEYDMVLNLYSLQNYKAILLYNNNVSEFTYSNLEKKDVETRDDKNNRTLIEADTIPKVIYNEKLSNTLYELKATQGNEENAKIVYEPTPKFDWVLLEDTKKIGSFVCNKATTFFRGRNYTAWYSSDIKGNFGPWKLQGLPGIILEAYDEKREVVFSLKKIEIPKKEKITFDKTKLKNILYETYKKKIKSNLESLQSKLQASQERGSTITIKFTGNVIEKE